MKEGRGRGGILIINMMTSETNGRRMKRWDKGKGGLKTEDSDNKLVTTTKTV